MNHKILIVGSGLYGCTFATIWKRNNPNDIIYMIERRNMPGGNISTYKYEDIDIHEYGPHIFHTDDEEVWKFINEFDEMIPYVQQTLAKDHYGQLYHLPFNMYTFKEIYGVTLPSEAKEKIEKDKIHYQKITNLEEQAISLVGKKIYNILIKNYTEKQWGKPCKKLDKNIITRIPVRYEYNNDYFNDKYSGIPKNGYSYLINNIINQYVTNIEYNININKEYLDQHKDEYDLIIYCGAIDELFDYKYGTLEWRSLKFINLMIPKNETQGCAIMNDVSKENKYTRTIEHQYFTPWKFNFENLPELILQTKEYPEAYDKFKERYYPVNNEETQKLYNKYVNLLNQTYNNVILGGRIGLYKYFDMDDTIRRAMDDANKLMNKLNK